MSHFQGVYIISSSILKFKYNLNNLTSIQVLQSSSDRIPGSLVHFGSYFQTMIDIDIDGEVGDRSDGKNFISEWKAQSNLTYITSRQELEDYQDDGNNLIGLFAHEHLEYDLLRPDDQPTVSQMTEVAIKKLEKNPNGFYLFVEGGQIDFGHHGNEAIAALYEFKEQVSPV